jgi:glucose/arabinose dehydrogenase
LRNRNSSQVIRRAARTALIDSLESRLLFTSILPEGFGETLVAENIISPTSMAFAPDGRLFVAEKGGALRVIKNGNLLTTPFTTVAASTFSERGLGGVAIDPHFDTNGYIYLYYTAETPAAHNRISRFTIVPGGDVAVGGSEQVILDLPDAGNGTAHNGGAMKFLPDGTLLVGVGDHTNGFNAQDMNTPFGKILRINPDGSIPNDNPFYNSTTGIYRAIWSLGVRNPFTMDVQPGTGRVFINDVGAAQWEEINDGAPGRNFGWTTTEGPFDPVAFPNFTNPLFAYNHAEGSAVTGGAFYNPQAAQFPAEYVGQYFFADFAAGWIRRINPTTKAVTPFATDAFGAVDLDVGSDGSLYWLSRFDNSVFKISATLAPQVSTHPQSQLISVGGPVTFSVGATGANLNYQWQRGGVDILGANASSYTIASTALIDSGAQFRCVVTNVQGSTMSNTATLTVTADQPPVPTILTPIAGTTYSGGMNVSYSGSATDNEDGNLDGSRMTWWVDFHHADHIHPFLPPTTGATVGTFEIPTLDHAASNVWYRINFSVTDSAGFTRTTYRDLQPQLATITVQASHPGLQLAVDGQPRTTPIVFTGVVNTIRTLSAAEIQSVTGLSYDFLAWSDGGAATHQIFIPASNTTYTASYQPFTHYHLSDRDWISQSGQLPPTRDGNQWGSPITIEGVEHARGLGVSAHTDVTYALNGGFERFMATIGVDDVVGPAAGSVTFEVWVDGVLRFDSGLMTGAMAGMPIDVDVTGANELRLYVSDGGDNSNSDQSDWADARLVNLSHAAPTAPEQLVAIAPLYNRVKLTWLDRLPNEAAFLIERSTDGVNFTQIASVAAGVTSFVDAYRNPATTYSYRVRAQNGVGNSPYTAVASVTTPSTTLAFPWSEADVGDVKPAYSGSVVRDGATGAMTLTGSGLGIGTEADAMHFVYQTLAGDGRITARLTGWTGMNFDTAAAGLMFRESLDANARSVAMLLSAGPSSASQFLRREIVGGDTTMLAQGYFAPPQWLKLERAGDTFTAWISPDGVNYTPFGSGDVTMGTQIYVGLVVSSANGYGTTTATLDNVLIENPTPVVVNPAAVVPNPVAGSTAALSALGSDDAGESNLNYTWSAVTKPAGAADPLFSINGTNAAKNSVATFAKAGVYQLRVRMSDGSRFVDSTVSVTVTQTLASVTVSPATFTLARGTSKQFAAVANDQFGDAMATQPAFEWSVASGGGAISASGVYTASSSEGSATITAAIAGQTPTGSADITIVRPAPSIVQAPTATPNPSGGVSAALSVLADSEAGESTLVYTWSTTAIPPGAAAVLFSANGSNAAKQTTVTFDRAGSYTFSVAIFDGLLTTTAQVTLVVQQAAQRVVITPGVTQIEPLETCAYSAVVYDQFDRLMTPTIDWTVDGDGTITAAGAYTAGPTQGTYLVTATVAGTSISESVEVVVDLTGPIATWNTIAAPDPGDSEWLFQVTYTDAHGVNVGMIGDDDILVTAPNGQEYVPQLVAINAGGDGSPRVATYRLVPVGGSFVATGAPGTWTISTMAETIADVLGNHSPAADIGSFVLSAEFASVHPGGVLVVHGTVETDSITLGLLGGQVVVTVNGVSVQFATASVSSVLVRGYDGDDQIDVSGLDQTLNYIGGTGADTIHVLGGTLVLGDDVGAGVTSGGSVGVSVESGANLLFMGSQHLASLTLLGNASAAIEGEIGASYIVVLNDLALASTATLDIGAGAMIINNVDIGWSTGGSYSGITGSVASGFSEGSWTGPGITSRFAADGAGLTGVGIGLASAIVGLDEAESVGVWRGETVTGNSVLLTFTYMGDANLDGFISGDDYSTIDFNMGAPGGNGYFQGDFNYDGIISGDDYSTIDFNFAAQGAPLIP